MQFTGEQFESIVSTELKTMIHGGGIELEHSIGVEKVALKIVGRYG